MELREPTTLDEQLMLSSQPVEYRTHLIEKCAFEFKTDVRKLNAWKRWQIFTEQHAPLVLDCVLTTQNDANIRNELQKFIDLTVNPALDITKQTSVVWRQGARREIAGATPEQLKAFHELVLESRIDALAPTWNRIAAFVGPMLVAPAIRKSVTQAKSELRTDGKKPSGGELRFDVLLPTYTDVEIDPEDRHGLPLSAAWTVRDECEDPVDATVVVLDDSAWTTYQASLGEVRSDGTTKPAKVLEIDRRPHDLGYFPAVPLRFDAVIDGDWWGSPFLNQRLVDATVRLGTLNAVLAFTRKSQNKKLLALIGDLGGFPDGQTMDPEVPFVADVPPGSGPPPTVTAIDFDTDPARFIQHAEWISRNIANAYGGQVESDPQGITSRIVFSVDALSEIRREQVPHATMFERLLWANAVDMARKMGHRLGPALPSREQILEGFSVDYGTLSQRFADPSQEAEHTDWKLSKGAIDQIEIVRAQGNWTLTDEQIKEKIQRRLDNQSWFNGTLATRNLSLVDGKVSGTAQANGAMGPALRDGKPLAIGGALPGPQGADGFAAAPGGAPPERRQKIDPETGAPIEGEFEEVEAAPTMEMPEDPNSLAARGGDVQATALNGAQISSFIELAKALAAKELPLELGVQFLPIAFPGSVRNPAAAQKLLASLKNFEPPKPDPPPGADAFGADAPGEVNSGKPGSGFGRGGKRFGGKPSPAGERPPQDRDQGS